MGNDSCFCPFCRVIPNQEDKRALLQSTVRNMLVVLSSVYQYAISDTDAIIEAATRRIENA